MAENHLTPRPPPGEIVLADYGWISGPMPGTEEVRADEIRRGDVVVHDGRALTVTEDPVPGWYWEDGRRVHGLEIAARNGPCWRFLYRHPSEVLQRVQNSARAGGTLGCGE